MSNAIKCDRCGACYEYGGMTVGEEYDLCDGCVADFEAWVNAGRMHGERVTESGEMPHDTREQLESYVTLYLTDRVCLWEKQRYELRNEVSRWLDRQAAITERDMLDEMQHVFVPDPADITMRDERIVKLQREIATLKEHRAANMEKLHELTDECAELRKYRDEWKGLAEKYRADSIAAQEETERYRAKLGDVLDALHEAERAAR